MSANLSRIVACVNVCAGMADPETEIARLRQDKAELVAALKPLAKATEAFGAFSDSRDKEEIWLWVRSSNIKGQEYGITLQDALNAKAALSNARKES